MTAWLAARSRPHPLLANLAGPLLYSLVEAALDVLRSAIPLVMYALFEARTKNTVLSADLFFADRAHVFLAVVLLLGVLLGFANINLRRSLATVSTLTARLRQYSEWSLGRGILDRATAAAGADARDGDAARAGTRPGCGKIRPCCPQFTGWRRTT